MAIKQPVAPVWWEHDAHLLRFVCDLVAGELSLLRRSRVEPGLPWPGTLHIGRDLGADSLEVLSVATALSDMLHLHRSGIEDYLLARLEIEEWAAIARQSLRQFSAELTFRTSGSAGIPKRCTHPVSSLWQEVAVLAALLPGRRRILSAVPSHHIYGFLFTVLLPQAPGMQDLDVLDVRGSSAARLAHELRAGDLVVAHPEFWRAALQSQPLFAPGVIGVTSSAPCPDELAEALLAAGLDKLIQVYGSSETGGVGWRESAAAPFQAFPYWRRVAEDDAVLERTLLDGACARCAIQDTLEWVGTDTFRPAGRIDQAVQVAGINVFPAQVAAALREHPAVLDASVRLMRADEGNRLKAFIVPRAAHADRVMLQAQLAAWSRERFDSSQRPMAFSFGSQLPRQANEKLADWIIDATG
ncbi:AMP-binding protein [Massilia psychrophila]|uniref:4-coumarate--CoA ligase n=1 Tax=Massilia psychrophila TaxID=1603353 RepID=A0A2G8T511_9BURK|nr:AMP-binding protein [Massilia psychrophila]PIL41131.1 4-coumarate--CoA ligase [Massilia psychrophila]GGE66777.1 hypothetical protein GCM10008020_08880 [Massilia psychrophila]